MHVVRTQAICRHLNQHLRLHRNPFLQILAVGLELCYARSKIQPVPKHHGMVSPLPSHNATTPLYTFARRTFSAQFAPLKYLENTLAVLIYPNVYLLCRLDYRDLPDSLLRRSLLHPPLLYRHKARSFLERT